MWGETGKRRRKSSTDSQESFKKKNIKYREVNVKGRLGRGQATKSSAWRRISLDEGGGPLKKKSPFTRKDGCCNSSSKGKKIRRLTTAQKRKKNIHGRGGKGRKGTRGNY